MICTWEKFSTRFYLSMGLYSNNDLPSWPSRVLLVWAEVMKKTGIDSAHPETASEHAVVCQVQDAYDVINLFLSHPPPHRRWGRSCHCPCSVSWVSLLPTLPQFLFKTVLTTRLAWIKNSTSVQSTHKFSKIQNWATISILLYLGQALSKYWVWWIPVQVSVCPRWLQSVPLFFFKIKFPSHSFYIHICTYS